MLLCQQALWMIRREGEIDREDREIEKKREGSRGRGNMH